MTANGNLPPGWRRVKLGDVAAINPRRPPSIPHSPDTPTTFVPMASIKEDAGGIETPLLKPFAEVSKGYTYFEEGDVLFAKITPCMQNGKHAIARGLSNGFGFGTTEFHVIRPKAQLTPEWIHLFVRQPKVLKNAAKHFRGAVGQQRVPKEFLAHLPIPLPPLAEQKRIVARLNEQMAVAEKARKAAEELLDNARALPNAFLREALPFEEQRLPRNWRWVALGEVCDLIRGVVFEKTQARLTPTAKHLPVLRAGNISDVLITEDDLVWIPEHFISREQRLQSGDIVMCISSGSASVVGKTASLYGDWPGTIGAFCAIIRARPLGAQHFLGYYLRSAGFTAWRDSQARGANIQNLRTSELLRLPIPLPPLAEQKRIVARLNKQTGTAEQARRAAEAALADLRAVPNALLRRALAGAF